ncbi:uncharacterized protein LOC115302415 [Suricata suricatta]|uniref:uncharacterized protein LOC115302415 n=1 Tax=Suricata suricatta TaxID=37032 RepID=UPI001155A7B3|nr:uncharacterized protein LOC115302415 [Suricata suricatta]
MAEQDTGERKPGARILHERDSDVRKGTAAKGARNLEPDRYGPGRPLGSKWAVRAGDTSCPGGEPEGTEGRTLRLARRELTDLNALRQGFTPENPGRSCTRSQKTGKAKSSAGDSKARCTPFTRLMVPDTSALYREEMTGTERFAPPPSADRRPAVTNRLPPPVRTTPRRCHTTSTPRLCRPPHAPDPPLRARGARDRRGRGVSSSCPCPGRRDACAPPASCARGDAEPTPRATACPQPQERRVRGLGAPACRGEPRSTSVHTGTHALTHRDTRAPKTPPSGAVQAGLSASSPQASEEHLPETQDHSSRAFSPTLREAGAHRWPSSCFQKDLPETQIEQVRPLWAPHASWHRAPAPPRLREMAVGRMSVFSAPVKTVVKIPLLLSVINGQVAGLTGAHLLPHGLLCLGRGGGAAAHTPPAAGRSSRCCLCPGAQVPLLRDGGAGSTSSPAAPGPAECEVLTAPLSPGAPSLPPRARQRHSWELSVSLCDSLVRLLAPCFINFENSSN